MWVENKMPVLPRFKQLEWGFFGSEFNIDIKVLLVGHEL